MTKKLLDLSTHNGVVDMKKVKKSGIYGIIQRAGYGSNSIDKTAVRNIDNALKAGLKVGAYWFIYSLNVDDAIREADRFNKFLSNYKGKLELPVYCDFEYDTERYANQNGVYFSKRDRTDMVKAFCNRLEEHGWYVGNYTNVDYYLNRWYQDELDRFDTWIADWRSYPDRDIIEKSGVWQYTSKGRCDGVSGNVDINILYRDYPSIIRNAKLNGFTDEKPKSKKKTVDELAKEVLDGKWGNGSERVEKLTAEGYDYDKVQAKVNEILDIEKIAEDVIRGDYGNGYEREMLLKAKGYDYEKVQEKVNELLD